MSGGNGNSFSGIRPVVKKYRSKRNTAEVTVSLPEAAAECITDVVLKYRGIEALRHSLVWKRSELDQIVIFIDFDRYEFRELSWDLIICLGSEGGYTESKVFFESDRMKRRFFICNTQYRLKNGMLIFPYHALDINLAFMYRKKNKYDSYGMVIKEVLSYVIFLLFGKLLKRKKIWVVYEKFCSMAQDNGYYFFIYCMNNLPEPDKKHIVYIIDKSRPDYAKVKQYKRHVVRFMSIRHMLCCMSSQILIASDSRAHALPWRRRTGILSMMLNRRPIFFLQHGVTALKCVDHMYGKNGTDRMTFFDTTSVFEQKIVMDYFGYDKEEAPVTGFARWDVLEDRSSDKDRILLIMPTWRSWLEEVNDDVFLESDYYKRYLSLIKSGRFAELLDDYGVRAIFYIHPKFADYIAHFTANERVDIIPFGKEPLNEIMMRSKALLTDYSSVCWDMYYQKKPVFFYQFDYDLYNSIHGSYIDMQTELFGTRVTGETDLYKELEACFISDFSLSETDSEKHSFYFPYVDDKNSERIYDFIKTASDKGRI